MGRIRLRSIEFHGHCGIAPEERAAGQRLAVDLDLGADLGRAIEKDDGDQTVDYVAVSRLVVDLGTRLQFNLIESLAARIADEILKAFPLVNWARVEVRKWPPQCGAVRDGVSVRVFRTR